MRAAATMAKSTKSKGARGISEQLDGFCVIPLWRNECCSRMVGSCSTMVCLSRLCSYDGCGDGAFSLWLRIGRGIVGTGILLGANLAANESFPMRDRSSLLVTLRMPSHDLVRDEISCSFSGGNLSCSSEKSRTMPRKVMQVDGPSHFSGGNLSCSSEESRTMSRKVMQVDGPSHFSGGNLSCSSEESRTMSRKVMQVDGPSHFSGGNLSCSSEKSRTMSREVMQVDGPHTSLVAI